MKEVDEYLKPAALDVISILDVSKQFERQQRLSSVPFVNDYLGHDAVMCMYDLAIERMLEDRV